MSEASGTFRQLTLWDIDPATSSPASAGGPSPFDSPDGLTTARCGPEVVHANPTRRQARGKATRTRGTCGPTFTGSSASQALTRCLVSRLKERLGRGGSMEFKETWKEKVTPSGIAYWAHTASTPRTSASGCSGWPSPKSQESGDTVETYEARRDRHGSHATGGPMGLSLTVAAQLAS